MKYLTTALLVLLLLGCGDSKEERVFTQREKAQNRADAKENGATRRAIFKECMELAAQIPQKAKEDVSEIVSECQKSSYYMANSYTSD